MAQVTELDDRIAKCNKILEDNPNSQIFAALAEALRKRGEVDKAFRICQTGLKIHPDYGSAHVVMAKINFDKGLFDWSEMEALKAVELDGESHATDLLLAEIYIQKSDFAAATRILNKLQSHGVSNQHVARLLELAKKLPLRLPEKQVSRKISTPHREVHDTASAIAEKEAEKITIRELIDTISELAGVEGVLLVNQEGLVAESCWDDSQPIELYGALTRDVEKTIQSQIDIAHFGHYENVLIEASDLVINMLPLNDNFLLIKANKQLNLGTLRLRLASLLEKLDRDFSQ